MIYLKTEEEINLIKESADILGRAHGLVAQHIKPGISTLELDKLAFEFIKDSGGSPSFKGYNGFPSTLCVSLNEQVVHGMPSKYVLEEGDIVSVDCGVFYKGFHSDSAYSYPVGDVGEASMDLLRRTKESLWKGIEAAKVGKFTGDIGYAVQQHAEQFGYGVVRELVGHGVGRNLHEDPEVPNYGRRGKGKKLKAGMVIAIEPMINLGTKDIVQEADGWTIRTTDYKPSAHFEHTIAIFADRTEVLTTHKYIEEHIKI
ncbi:type I methionyl aminopeptidase [Persicobacter psychrovividus]|uniref:Methionine aminopeptidase n=1 Tax=Persicobacter psychrovividus TaxID=387638 RepID=A0ABM7VGF8_9BACT|nr:methionine aminopeptidase [Persicobacter psychrovividus]